MATLLTAVGEYELGPRRIKLLVDPDDGGGSFRTRTPNGITEIVVGIRQRDWCRAISICLHEFLELALSDLGARLQPDMSYSLNDGDYLFMFDHQKFSEAVARSAYCFGKCFSDLFHVFQRALKADKKSPRRKTRPRRKRVAKKKTGAQRRR